MSVICEICKKIFSASNSLNRHLRNIHNSKETIIISYAFDVYNNKCLEGCNCSFKTTENLRQHLQRIHKYELETERLQFESLEDFNIWLKTLCCKENIQYNKSKTARKTMDHEIIYYYCNRSGVYQFKENRKRKLKSQGSNKLNRACTSAIILTKMSNNCIYYVTYFKTHYKHDVDLQHLRFSKEIRTEIAEKLASGITVSRVLENNRTAINSNNLKKSDLLTKKDITNIKASFNINISEGVRHRDDAVSVNLWVEECASIENSILLYKRQGEEHLFLELNDFCLIFMNDSQKHMLNMFGHNVLCIDSTHGLNHYDFELTTLLIIDDFGEGFPVSFMFTNRKDTFINKVFFNEIKNRTGILSPKTFMSDITTVFYSAWVDVMGHVKNQLFCSWHVDRAWQSNLSKIPNIEKRQNVYQALKYLQYNLDENCFVNEFNKTIQLLNDDDDTKIFGEYLKKNYSSNVQQWAYCYRKNCGINTNMFLESMHKVVKYFYLNAKKIKRLDKAIYALMTYLRDKTVDRIIKTVKGKNTYHISEISKRHAVALSSSLEIELNDLNTWTVKGSDGFYLVSKEIQTTNNICCYLKCDECQICVHAYRCSCVDYFIKSTICQHIHYLLLSMVHVNKNNINTLENNYSHTLKKSLNSALETKIHLKTIGNKNTTDEIEDKNIYLKKQLKEILSKFILDLDKNPDKVNENVLHHSVKTLNNLHSILFTKNITAIENFTEVEEHFEPAHKKIKKQVAFYSTKNKTSKRKGKFNKPNTLEGKNIKNTLLDKPFISADSQIDHHY